MKTYTELVISNNYIASYSSDHNIGSHIVHDILGIADKSTASYDDSYNYVGKLLNDERCHIINIEDRFNKSNPAFYIHLWYEEIDKNNTITID